MGRIARCPDCGKVIALIFPLHGCKPKVKKMPKRYWYTKSSRTDKLNWLLNHQSLWEGWKDLGDRRQKEIVTQMKADGLVSDKTNWQDVNLTSLIYEARKMRRDINFKLAEEELK